MPLFEIDFPENAVLFYSFLVSVSSFDVLPTDQINEQAFNLKNSDSNQSEGSQ